MAGASHDGLETALAKAGWLSGEFHHSPNLPKGAEAFGFGVRGDAPWIEVTIEPDQHYAATFRESPKAEAETAQFQLAAQVVTQMNKWRAALPEDRRALLRP